MAEGRRYLGLDVLTRSRLSLTDETDQEADPPSPSPPDLTINDTTTRA